MTVKPETTRPFDPAKFALRLKRAQTVVLAYRILRLASTTDRDVYEVSGSDKPYLVIVDTSGQGEHFCSCPDGRVRIEVAGKACSLCKHALACILNSGRPHLLMPFLCLKSKTGSPL